LRKWLNYVVDSVRRPREELSKRQHQLRFAWELAVHCWRQLLRHRAEGMAAELTYRTIFALIPVVVLSLVLFRLFGGLDEVQVRVENQLYSFFGVPEIPGEYVEFDVKDDADGDGQVSLEAELVEDPQDVENAADPAEQMNGSTEAVPAEEAAKGGAGASDDPSSKGGDWLGVMAKTDQATDGESVQQSAEAENAEETADALRTRASIRRTLHEATTQIADLDFASIGVFGLILFIYAAVALADSTEYLFNIIFDAPSQRPIHIRVAIHWSIITLGSGLLALSLYLSGQVIDWFGTIGAGAQPLGVLQHLVSVIAGWVLLFLLYALMPNTQVSPRAAAVGAAVGAGLWEIAKLGFQIYVSKAVPYSALYGSLGLIPLFLLWIYTTWLIVLFGLILTVTLQTMRGRRLMDRRDRQRLLHGDPDWMLPIMTEVAHAFRLGQAIGRQDLADRLGLSSRIVHEMENRLIEGGCLQRVASSADQERLTLAQPAEQIPIARILGLAHQFRPTNDHPAWKTLAGLKQAERDAAADRTLADLLPLKER